MLCTESINSNAQYMNGMTPFHLDLHCGKLVQIQVRLLDTLEHEKCQ